MHVSDSTTFELGQARLRLRDGLRFSIQVGKHENWYLVEDDVRGNYFRIGEAEYAFLSVLDGQTTLATALAQTCSTMGAGALGEQDAINLCKWLVESGLASTKSSASASRVKKQQDSDASQEVMQKLNPISVRFTLWNPDSLVTSVSRYINWLINWPLAFVWMAVVLYASIMFARDWDRFIQGTATSFSRDGFLWIGLSWAGLKLIHESAHAFACKRFGGKVESCGILLLLLIPLPFVDVTSAWKFPNKYQRIFTSAAGMIAEIFIAAIAAIVWTKTDPGTLNTVASSLIVAASLHTLIFNANPLMRFDGYHMLTDWLEIPNLGNHAAQYTRNLARAIFLGQPGPRFAFVGIHGQLIKSYGIASLLWKTILCVTLSIAALNLLTGFGLLIALFAMFMWVMMPVWKFATTSLFNRDVENKARTRFGLVAGIGALVLILGSQLPGPSVINAPFVVDYESLEIVRAETAGFVETVAVEENQIVKRGDLLVVLRNEDLDSQIAKLQTEIEQTRIRARVQKNAGEVALWQIETETLVELETQIRELQSNEAKLTICAPADGQVIGVELNALRDTFVDVGQELLSMGASETKEAIVLVSQNETQYLADVLGKPVQLRIWGHQTIENGTVTEVNPKSRDDVPHFSFAGMYGGPLEVIDRSQVDSPKDSDAISDEEPLKLVDSRIRVDVGLDSAASQRLKAGQTGIVHFRNRDETLGHYVYHNGLRWLRERVRVSHGL